MKNIVLVIIMAVLSSANVFAKEGKDTSTAEFLTMVKYIDSVNTAMKYERGTVTLKDGIATLKIPAGFKFLNAAQSQFVLSEVWGNPNQPDVLGMLFPETGAPFADSSYAFVISFDPVGFVKDDDADDIDYDDMLKEIHEGEADVNKERMAQGFESIHMVGWAQKPYYDKERKVLHWAKELKFGTEEGENTLNYDIRILGRKGVLSFNAVAGIGGLELVKKDIDKVLVMSDFTKGNKYSDFNPDIDEVAAYTVGGLVAGKVLAKAGFLVLLAKFWKLIAAGAVGIFYAVKKFFIRKKKDDELMVEEPAEETTNQV